MREIGLYTYLDQGRPFSARLRVPCARCEWKCHELGYRAGACAAASTALSSRLGTATASTTGAAITATHCWGAVRYAGNDGLAKLALLPGAASASAWF